MADLGVDASPDPDPDPTPPLGPAPGLGLLGIELGAGVVRLALLDSTATRVTDAVERPMGIDDGPMDRTAETRLQTALLAALGVLGLSEPTPVLMGATIGLANSGVGSGPALSAWLENLSARIGEPFLCVGDRGVSYAPAGVAIFLRRVFEPLPLHLDRVELAPVAACRMVEELQPGAVTLGSGVAWSARVLGRDVLEAYEMAGGSVDQALTISSDSSAGPIERLAGVEVDPELLERRGLTVGSLAPAVGVAVALRTSPATNLLAARLVGKATRSVGSSPAGAAPTPPSLPGTTMHSGQPGTSDGGRNDLVGVGLAAARNTVVEPGWDDQGPTSERPRSATMPAGQTQGPGSVRWDRYEAYGRPDPQDDIAADRDQRRRPPGPAADASGFHVSDFVLGALLMLLVVLTVALVAL